MLRLRFRPVYLAYKPYFFSQRTVFFSHNKSTNSTFSHGLSAKRTGHLSNFAAAGVQGKKTIKLTGLVNNQQILILLDSGSSCTFISEKSVDTLRLAVTKVPPVSVTVANGEKVSSDTHAREAGPGL